MAQIPFPNVPDVPGVPAIPRSPNFPPTVQTAVGLLQGMLWRFFAVETQWGIFDADGKPLGDPNGFSDITSDVLQSLGLDLWGVGSTASTGAINYSKETKVSDFPIEEGSFASYNKVETPGAPVVTLCFSGNESTRKQFLNNIDAACKSTDLYSVVTPEVQYVGYSVERYGYQRRAASGMTLLVVEITLKEIRQVSAQYAKATNAQLGVAKNPDAEPNLDNGKVQPQAPKDSVLTGIVKGVQARLGGG